MALNRSLGNNFFSVTIVHFSFILASPLSFWLSSIYPRFFQAVIIYLSYPISCQLRNVITKYLQNYGIRNNQKQQTSVSESWYGPQ